MLVLARFLTPEDFGIVAMATITAFFFDVIGETGTPQYIAQKDTITSEDVNTAWTLNLIFKAACFVCFILAIPLISAYSENELIEPVLYCISLVIPLGALISPGLIVQSRNLNYKPITKLSIIEKLVSICVTIVFIHFRYRPFGSHFGSKLCTLLPPFDNSLLPFEFVFLILFLVLLHDTAHYNLRIPVA